MGSILLSLLPLPAPNHSNTDHLLRCVASSKFPFSSSLICPPKRDFQFGVLIRSQSQFSRNSFSDDGDSQETVEVLRVPQHWLEPSRALQESEWLKVSLHKWLDDEYCPEPTNVDISRIAADSYYRSLLQKTTDLGEILLRMVRQLETISYQDSYHGAFSSANDAAGLIAERIEHDCAHKWDHWDHLPGPPTRLTNGLTADQQLTSTADVSRRQMTFTIQ